MCLQLQHSFNNPVKFTDPTGHFSEDELLNKYKTFIGPNQLHGTRDGIETAYWYYLLRAADIGDILQFTVSGRDVKGQISTAEGKLVVGADDGITYGITWHGIVGGGERGILSESSRLFKPDGTTFSTEEQLRLFLNGQHSLLDNDYIQGSVGYFDGVEGQVSVTRDRLGNWHVGLSGGIGIGGPSVSLTRGNLIQGSVPDAGQLQMAFDGLGMALKGGFKYVGGSVPIVNDGPQPWQTGLSNTGAAWVVGYTWAWLWQ
jgi:hypothetical protein